MIKANELRIGNYVNGGTVYLNQMVVGITPSEIITINGKHYDIEDDLIQPIPLTPEILEKAIDAAKYFNVLKTSGSYTFLRMVNGETLEPKTYLNTDNVLILPDLLGGLLKPEPVAYLHQLQNFYFVFFGTELEINL